MTGRFLNADVYADTGSGSSLSTNMFAYCDNNPLNKFDTSGRSAVWLQDSHAVGTMGHTSLWIQEKGNRWWYFYWGDKYVMLTPISGRSLESLNRYLTSHKYINYQGKVVSYYEGSSTYKGTKGFNKTLYFHGDFSKSLKYIYKNLLKMNSLGHKIIKYSRNPSYLTLLNNCMQVSVDALFVGNFTDGSDYLYKKALRCARCWISPNVAFNGMAKIHTAILTKSIWSYLLWLYIPFMF